MRKTIAVLVDCIDHLSRGYEFELREAFDAGCRAMDVNLLICSGRPLDQADPWTAAHNAVYGVVGPASVDGVVLFGPGLASHAGVGAVERLAERYKGLPMCSLGLTIAGIPSVVVDNQSGMEALVEHLVVEHGCREVAYIGGPEADPDAQLRFEFFRHVMARRGKSPDPRLVRHTDFTTAKGQLAVEDLLRGGTTFDAVVAANDSLAIGAIDALRAHGLRVPLNVRVTGFDDLAMSMLADPPLTTVRQPLRAMANAALELVVGQIAGRKVPACSVLPAEVIARESCGCGSQAERSASLPPRRASSRSADFLRANEARLRRLLQLTLGGAVGTSVERATRILSSLEAELNGERYAFLVGLENLLGDSNHEISEDLQRAVTTLRDELRAVQDPELDELWHEARTHISLLNTRALMRQLTSLEGRYDRLLRTGERFSTNLGLSSLKSTLLEELPAAQVDNAFVSLYSSPERTTLNSFFCIRDGRLYEPRQAEYDAIQMFPVGAMSPERRYTWIVLPLIFESECLGIAGFELATSVVAYEMFRDRISSALKTAGMHHEIVRQTAAQERSNQERLATAERLKSLSALAGGVAHDLNNALGPLVALPDLIIQALQDPGSHSPAEELIADLATIKSAALRAAQTIKDLLTLGRQYQVSKETIDLNQVISGCAISASQGVNNGSSHTVVEMRLAEEPLFVHASEAHVARAVTNLIGNALEATTGEGVVRVNTVGLRLDEPLSGYEVIDRGDYAVVSVSDSGHGIPPDMIHRIFEPFFSRKQLHDGSGSGLGLAIVHGVVKEHQGFINVESTVGSGSVFTLYFPRVAVAHDSIRSEAPLVGSCTGRILVLDDDPTQLRTASRVLSRAGYDVLKARTAEEVYEMFRRVDQGGRVSVSEVGESSFDVVILDMILDGDQDGLDVFEQIRMSVPHQRAILVSGHAPMERGTLALQRGLAWLPKPYTADALVSIVRRTLSQQADQQPAAALLRHE